MTLSRLFFRINLVAACLFFITMAGASAQTSLVQAHITAGEIPLSLSYIKDDTNANSVIQASIEFTRMHAAGRVAGHPVIHFGDKAGVYWIELSFDNKTKNQDWWFTLQPVEAGLASPVKSMILYDPQEPQLKPVARWDGHFQSALAFVGVPLHIKAGETKSQYVLVDTWSGLGTTLVPHLRTQDNIQSTAISSMQKQGLAWLIIGAVFGIGLVQWLLTRQNIQGILALNALIIGAGIVATQRSDLLPFAATWHPIILPMALAALYGIGASCMLLMASIRYKLNITVCLIPLILSAVLFVATIANLDFTISQFNNIEYFPRYLITLAGFALISITLVQGFGMIHLYWFLPAWLALLSMPWLGAEFPYGMPLLYLVLLCVAGVVTIFSQWKSRDRETASIQKRLNTELKNIKEKFHTENQNWRKKMDTQRDMLNELRTREQQRVAELEIARKAADDANEAKSDFLAIISHEIRTPMNGIMGILQILAQTRLDEKQIEYVDVIKNSGDTMLTLLNDILDYSKIEKGAIEIEDILFNLRKMVNSIAMLMSGRAKDKGLRIVVEIDENVPDNFYGDPQRIRQVLLNLVGNAIKFTDKGSVTMRVSVAEPKTNRHADQKTSKANISQLHFEVIDTGIGISDEAQSKLFQAYVQADSSIQRRYGGTGLGLNICKMLVNAMKGEIKATSVEGQGSTFWFDIPLRISDVAPADESRKKALEEKAFMRTLDILVIDDNDINLKIVSTFLEMDGHHVVTAGSGAHALTLIEQEHFDLIFVDILMPGMNGQTFLRKLREKPDAYQANIPVFALTGMADKKTVDEITNMGVLGVLIKPITQEVLRNSVQKAFQHIQDEVKNISLDTIMAKLNTLSPEERDALRNALFGPEQATQSQAAQPQSAEDLSIEQPQFSAGLAAQIEDGSFTASTVSATPAALNQQDPQANPHAFLNMDILGELKNGLPAETLKEIFDDLIIKSTDLTSEIEEAATQSDFHDLGEIAHNLKGMAGNFGLQALMEHSGAIERAVRDNNNEKAAALVLDSRRVLEQSLQAITHWLNQ